MTIGYRNHSPLPALTAPMTCMITQPTYSSRLRIQPNVDTIDRTAKTMPGMSTVSWKFSDSRACSLTKNDWLAVSTISGGRNGSSAPSSGTRNANSSASTAGDQWVSAAMVRSLFTFCGGGGG